MQFSCSSQYKVLPFLDRIQPTFIIVNWNNTFETTQNSTNQIDLGKWHLETEWILLELLYLAKFVVYIRPSQTSSYGMTSIPLSLALTDEDKQDSAASGSIVSFPSSVIWRLLKDFNHGKLKKDSSIWISICFYSNLPTFAFFKKEWTINKIISLKIATLIWQDLYVFHVYQIKEKCVIKLENIKFRLRVFIIILRITWSKIFKYFTEDFN